MQIGAMNSPHGNVYEELEWIGKNGFDFVDFTIEPTRTMPKDVDVKRARKILKKYGLDVVGHMGDWQLPKDSRYHSVREVCKSEIIRAMRLLKKLGAKKITMHAFEITRSTYEDAEKMCFALYDDLLKEAKKLGVVLMVENDNFYKHRESAKLFIRSLDRYKSLGLHVDVGHANIGVKENLLGSYLKMYSGRLMHIHLSDNYLKEDNHLKLGAGKINWKKIIKTLKKYGYDGTITMETFRSGRTGILESKKKFKKWWETY